jgi:DNA-directed RNA polymerase specialized sigma24 family protein
MDVSAGSYNERDKALFAQFVAGEQEAFKRLYSLYERPLILYCQHLLPTAQEAQDVFQETWLRVVRVRKR